MKVLQLLASCNNANKLESLKDFVVDTAPSGSGFDNGTTLEIASDKKIVLKTSFHHINDSGMYDGWTDHNITITPSLLVGYRITISGRDKNNIKDYISDIFHDYLSRQVYESKDEDGPIRYSV